MNRYKLCLWAIITIVVVSCKTSSKPTLLSNNISSSVQSPIYQPDEMPFQPAAQKFFSLIHTKLDLSFDWENEYVIGNVVLKLTPYYFSQDSLVLDAKGFDIKSIGLHRSDSLVSLNYRYDGRQITIKLDRQYEKGQELSIEIDYIAKPNELLEEGSEAITGRKGLYFINADSSNPYKPTQIWTQGETESSSCWFPTIDKPNQKSTQEVYLTVDTSFTTLSNGELRISIDNGDGTRTDRWVQTKPHAPYLFMIAVGDFEVVKEYTDQDLELTYYLERGYGQYAQSIFGNTAEMINFFESKLEVKFPWEKYAQIVVRDYVSGAMENTSASLFIERLNQTPREKIDKNWDHIIAHELFHQWFGDLVTCESWSNIALNEAFATYSEYLWEEYKNGEDAADFTLHQELLGYLKESQTKRLPLIRYHYDEREDVFDRHSYNKGARVLHMLRHVLGDQAFFEGLNYYLKEHQFTDVEVHELRLAFEEVTGRDMQLFFDQWFLSPGHPEINFSYSQYNDTLHLLVDQVQDSVYSPTFKFEVDVAYYTSSEKVVKKVLVDDRSVYVKIPCTDSVINVVFDNDNYLLADVNYRRSVDELQYQILAKRNYVQVISAIDELKKDIEYPSIKDSIKLILAERLLADDFWAIRKEGISLLAEIESEQADSLLEIQFQKDDNSQVRLAALKSISTDSVRTVVNRKAVEDSSIAVSSFALSHLLQNKNVDSLDKVTYVKRFKEFEYLPYTNAIAGYYVAQNDTTKFDWLWDRFDFYNLYDKSAIGARIGELISVLNDQEEREVHVKRLKSLCANAGNSSEKIAAFMSLCKIESFNEKQKVLEEIINSESNSRVKYIYNLYLDWYVE